MMLTAVGALALLAAPAAAFQTQTGDPATEASGLDAVAADLAQTKPEDTPKPDDTTKPDGTTPEERANTSRLNAEQASRAKAENVAYDQQVAAAAQQEAEAQAAYAEETAAYEAEKARVAAEAAEQRLKWEADVAACKAGDTTRCAQPAVPPQN
jgi:hypothetical protein